MKPEKVHAVVDELLDQAKAYTEARPLAVLLVYADGDYAQGGVAGLAQPAVNVAAAKIVQEALGL